MHIDEKRKWQGLERHIVHGYSLREKGKHNIQSKRSRTFSQTTLPVFDVIIRHELQFTAPRFIPKKFNRKIDFNKDGMMIFHQWNFYYRSVDASTDPILCIEIIAYTPFNNHTNCALALRRIVVSSR